MTTTVKAEIAVEQRQALLSSLDPNKVGLVYDDTACYIACSSFDSTALIRALDRLPASYEIVDNEEVVQTFRHREDFKLAGNIN